MGGPERLHPIGSWPAGDGSAAPAALAELALMPGMSARPIAGSSGLQAGRTLGALTVTHRAGAGLSRTEERLLDDLAAQASLVLAHLDLAGVIERERAAGHLEDLTARERDVLDLMARGLSNQAIAAELHLSIKTVEPLVSSIFSKLELQQDGASNRRVLAVLAYLRA
ncbi:MAG: hypothetical protein J7513_10660 [Solirubrobacteraceae bacterium]|nr:hypothetical protein [Solirubrobacteraceae bacterium]